MRVAMVVWADAPRSAGGRSLQVHDLAHSLRGLLHEVTVLDARRIDRAGFAALRGADLVHVHGGVTPALIAPLAMLPNRRGGAVPMVCTLHGWHDHGVRNRMERAIERRGLHACTYVTVPNGSMLDALPPRVKDRALIVPHGVATRGMRPVVASETTKVLWLGRVCKEKGIIDALIAFQSAVRRVPALRLNVVGPVEAPELLPMLREAAAETAGRVRYTPFLDQPWNNVRADILLHTPHYDAFPRSVLEAMSAGAAVVATSVGGIPEMIEHETTGLLAAVHDTCAIADHLTRLATNIGFRTAIIERARTAFDRRFTIERMAARFAALFEHAVAV
jgi:glycosyltransferase involved in cell wall biosynthesis